ncbi:DUF397 domain-containing protein [Allokutzneria sp. NRRL B-24872]|uniref:DUF397 domain-containing protein n=1 Tax=Allokutzneria sp. NRRL B-24872 TaxID=1137961 RepID=UPI001AEFAC94|nr:DUF397 domain-containing protein [Allokutzneria sp. NRRL B-24872]
MSWRTSSYSDGGHQGQCVEVGIVPGRPEAGVHVRDTKDREGGTLVVGVDAWRRFVEQLKARA